MEKRPRVLFVHAGGRRERLAQLEQGVPMAQEFFYGLPQLRKQGLEVDLLETTELAPDAETWRYRWADRKDRRRSRELGMAHCERLFVEERSRLRTYDLLVAGTEYVALGLADHLRDWRGHGCVPMLFFVMGMLSKPLWRFPDGSRQRRRALNRYRDLLRVSRGALFLGEGEYRAALRLFPDLHPRLHFVPFGVDTDFWTPGQEASNAGERYVLFVGNDANRDIDMLLQIARAMPDQRFVALSSLLRDKVVPPNLQVIASHWKKAVLTDAEVRAYYRNAAAVLLPIKETLQPSGQSVALQAMACGCPVVISDFGGFWESGVFSDEDDIFFAQPNKLEAFVRSLSCLTRKPDLARRVGLNGRARVLERYRLDLFADRLAYIAAISRTETASWEGCHGKGSVRPSI
jgi:glycosyltransferase involved in cell wall biosynthesis